MSDISNALDRMDFWSRKLSFHYLTDLTEDAESHLDGHNARIHVSIAVTQFQSAQEAAREAQV